MPLFAFQVSPPSQRLLQSGPGERRPPAIRLTLGWPRELVAAAWLERCIPVASSNACKRCNATQVLPLAFPLGISAGWTTDR